MGLLSFLRSFMGEGGGAGDFQRYRKRIESLSIHEAEAEVEVLLKDESKFNIERPAPGWVPETTVELSVGVRRFFAKYLMVELKYGDLHLDWAMLQDSPVVPGMIALGTDAVDSRILAFPGREEVFLVDGTEPPTKRLEDRYPSLFHLVLLDTCAAHPETFPDA